MRWRTRAGCCRHDARPPAAQRDVAEIRGAGAFVAMISDGGYRCRHGARDPREYVDLYMGNRRLARGRAAAAGIKCLGGDMQCKMWPRDEKNENS